MKISANIWNRYISRLAAVNDKAAKQMQAYAGTHGLEDTAALIDYAYALSTKYGEAASAAACEMYDALAVAQGVQVAAAEPAETATYGEVSKAVRGSLSQSPTGQLLNQVVGRLVKQAGADTTLFNAERDGAEFAWIPSGDTCAFCLALASRGWQRISKKTLRKGHAEHIHANCDCMYSVRFDGESDVEGYDPDALLAKYNSFSGSPEERIRQWRRQLEAPKREKINAQKRMAYVRRKTAQMPPDEYARAVDMWNKFQEVDMSAAEKAHIVEELDNNLTAEEKENALVNRPIGDYHYYAVNKGHGYYKVYQKKPIESYDDVVEEVLSEMFGNNWRDQWEEIERSKKNL